MQGFFESDNSFLSYAFYKGHCCMSSSLLIQTKVAFNQSRFAVRTRDIGAPCITTAFQTCEFYSSLTFPFWVLHFEMAIPLLHPTTLLVQMKVAFHQFHFAVRTQGIGVSYLTTAIQTCTFFIWIWHFIFELYNFERATGLAATCRILSLYKWRSLSTHSVSQ